MRFSFSILLLLCFLNIKAQNKPEIQEYKKLYVGTYTNTNSKGIYTYNFNTKTGELSNKVLVATVKNPSFLALSANKKNVYAVSEIANFNNSYSGFINLFANKNSVFELLDTISSKGAHPCHISIHKNENVAVVSNYTGGTASIYSISKNNGLFAQKQVINHTTISKNSHVHSAKFYKNNLFVADLGLNSLYHYFKPKNDSVYKLVTSYFMGENSGPRHFEISKKAKFIYVINELNSTVSVLKRQKNNYGIIQNLSTLNTDFNKSNSCADLHLSKNENFLYGSNRGENSIVVFKRNKHTGMLKKIQNISTYGNWPRNFVIDPSGEFLLAANERSENISIYKINKRTGMLTYLNSVTTPTPVCLLF